MRGGRQRVYFVEFDGPLARTMLVASVPFLALALIDSVGDNADLWLVSGLVTRSAEVGLYAAAMVLAEVPVFLFLGLNRVIFASVVTARAEGDCDGADLYATAALRTAIVVSVFAVAVTAFIASRVIGVFEGSIEKLVALAALMPIVAGIGGNSGNQTITMIVRAIALGQVSREHARQLIRKEITVSLLNGLVWGGVMGLVAMLLYRDVSLGLVMVLAMTLNLILAALMGVIIPMTMLKLGRDPAIGSSVMITAVTDSGGFFIFLGLATVFLLR